MAFMRRITWLSIAQHFIITAGIDGHHATAETPSCFNIRVFQSLCPEASLTPPAPPQSLALY